MWESQTQSRAAALARRAVSNASRALWSSALLALVGCAVLRPARGTLATRAFVERGPASAEGVIVMLPGFGDRPSDFDNHGFAARLAEAAPGYDLVGVDLHFNYYRRGLALPRLRQDVIEPLRKRGYRELWLLGISMGGLGAVTFARSAPMQVTGLLLFAPFWGRGQVVAEVARANSLCEWEAALDGEALSAEDRAFLANWRFLQQVGCEAGPFPDLWVAHGASDPPSKAGSQLVERLAPDRHVQLPGGHDWQTWSNLVEAVAPRAFDRSAPAIAEAAD